MTYLSDLVWEGLAATCLVPSLYNAGRRVKENILENGVNLLIKMKIFITASQIIFYTVG